jgi:hypothetical protein
MRDDSVLTIIPLTTVPYERPWASLGVPVGSYITQAIANTMHNSRIKQATMAIPIITETEAEHEPSRDAHLTYEDLEFYMEKHVLDTLYNVNNTTIRIACQIERLEERIGTPEENMAIIMATIRDIMLKTRRLETMMMPPKVGPSAGA